MSSLDPRLAAVDVVIKLASHRPLDASFLQLVMLDRQGRVVEANTTPLAADAKGLSTGPSWSIVRTRPTKMSNEVVAVRAQIAGLQSEPITRTEAASPIALRPVDGYLGLPREPHFWWRFHNRRSGAIAVAALFASVVLEIDGHARPVLAGAYNGPASLANGRAISGFWSLDDVDPSAARGMHRFRAGMLGEWSEPFSYERQQLA